MERCLLVLAALAAAGCAGSRESQDPDRLPRAVAVAMVVGGGQPITAWFSVEPNPRGHIDVRVASGLELPGPEGVFSLEPADAARASWALTERVGGARVPFALSGARDLRPVYLGETEAWLFARDAEQGWACALQGGACRAVGLPLPEHVLRRAGPGEGFRLELDEGTLRFRQPHQPDDVEADVVATRVDQLIGVRWYIEAPSARVAEYVDRTFRGRGSLRATFGEVTVDGELGEWADAEPQVVDAPWQAAEREGWNGPADASFSVASRWTEADLCFAGRVRDDALTPDDSLTFVLKRERWELPLHEAALADFPAAVRREAFGWHYEACVPRPDWLVQRADRPFAVLLRDADGEAGADLLATSPIFGAFPVGTLEVVP